MMFDGKRILNTALRLTTLCTRFVFIFILAKYLNADSVGYYGLFTAAVGYALLGMGLDFYTYSTREILKVRNDRRGQMLKSQGALAATFYLVSAPIAFAFLNWVDWPGHLVWWFVPILILEHLNQELYRLLIVLSEQLTASVLLFVRQASWAVAVVIFMSFDVSGRDLDTVMLFWAGAGVLAAALGARQIQRLRLGGWREPVDWRWLKRGLAVSTTFLIATLALRGIQTVDRYWLETLAGIEIVGAYVLFFGIASSLMVFLDASVFSFVYPELILHSNNNEHENVRKKVKKTLYVVSASSASFFLVSMLVLPYLLDWIGKAVYTNEMGLYLWIFAATAANAIGMVPHYALYARGRDRAIIASHVAALPAFAVSTWFLSRIYITAAVPIGVFIAFSFVLIWKALAYARMIRNDHRQDLSMQL